MHRVSLKPAMTAVALQEELGAIARAGGVRLFGPNCLGLLHAKSRFTGTFKQRVR